MDPPTVHTLLSTLITLHSTLGLLAAKPNIVIILTDDQDSELGGAEPLEAGARLLKDQGAQFTNAFVTTPICCPSRASILTGRYLHNTGVKNNTVTGGCSSQEWRQGPERKSFAFHLKSAGYKTMYAGKYLNQYGTKEGGGVEHIPLGWDFWAGLVGNSRYYDYTLSNNGKKEKHGDNYTRDYLTDVIRRKAVQFLTHFSKISSSDPFLMVLSPPACHAPFTPAPQYKDKFKERQAPRNKAFNWAGGADDSKKHWLMETEPRTMSNQTVELVDEVFRNRWRTLLSVDDLISKVHHTLANLSLLENTYILLTSDHGYHLGQFGMPWDKRLPYEFDIRVPFWISGPNISAGQTIDTPILNIDIAPTLLDIAGLPAEPNMDGLSFLSLVRNSSSSAPPLQPDTVTNEIRDSKVKPEEEKSKDRGANSSSGIGTDYSGIEARHSFLVEYTGEASSRTSSPNCSEALSGDLEHMAQCDVRIDCKCQDSGNNTYWCVRSHGQEDTMFCQFQDNDNFLEMYSLSQDRFQLTNLAPLLQNETLKHYMDALDLLRNCRGEGCNNV